MDVTLSIKIRNIAAGVVFVVENIVRDNIVVENTIIACFLIVFVID